MALAGLGKCVLGSRVREFSVHTGLFLASEKQDVQSGLYQPGRGRRSPCPQETVHKFLTADARLNFPPGGVGGEKTLIWLFLRAGQARVAMGMPRP